MNDVVGTWHLVAEHRAEGQADPEALDYDHDGNGVWMQTSGAMDVATATSSSGLTLAIATDGTFAETGKSTATLFDAEGVETLGEGFEGRLEPVGSRLWAFTGDRFNEPVPSIAEPAILRLSDGSTDIAECFEVVDGRLVRTQNVATDGIYLVRAVLIYDRTAPATLSEQAAEAGRDGSPQQVEAKDCARQDAEAALTEALRDSVRGAWKEIVAYANADGSHIMTTTFSVNVDESGGHRLAQDFDPHPRVESLWADHRAAATSERGQKWGTAVVVVRPDRAAEWHVDYRVSRVMRGEHDDTYKRYRKYLPIFLEENGFDQ